MAENNATSCKPSGSVNTSSKAIPQHKRLAMGEKPNVGDGGRPTAKP